LSGKPDMPARVSSWDRQGSDWASAAPPTAAVSGSEVAAAAVAHVGWGRSARPSHPDSAVPGFEAVAAAAGATEASTSEEPVEENESAAFEQALEIDVAAREAGIPAARHKPLPVVCYATLDQIRAVSHGSCNVGSFAFNAASTRGD
jgi:hypothetical protein